MAQSQIVLITSRPSQIKRAIRESGVGREDGDSASAAGVLQAVGRWAYPAVQSIARGDDLRSIIYFVQIVRPPPIYSRRNSRLTSGSKSSIRV
jgi:hypothetical protein